MRYIKAHHNIVQNTYLNEGIWIHVVDLPSCCNLFIPEFLQWTLPSLNFGMPTDADRGFGLKYKTKKQKRNRMANSVDPGKTAHYETSNLI